MFLSSMKELDDKREPNSESARLLFSYPQLLLLLFTVRRLGFYFDAAAAAASAAGVR